MVGRVMWELIEPLDEEGIYARFLAEKGEGVPLGPPADCSSRALIPF
jgi:hypothetical protein